MMPPSLRMGKERNLKVLFGEMGKKKLPVPGENVADQNYTPSYGKVESVTEVCCGYLKLASHVKTIKPLKTCLPAKTMASIP